MSKLQFTLIQGPLVWEDARANRSYFESQLAKLEGTQEIVVLPEMFTTGFSVQTKTLAESMDGESVLWMKKMAAQHRIILAGSLIIKESDQLFNRLIWMQPDGHYGVYDKRHLFSFAGEDTLFTTGKKRLIAQVKGWKICTLICYDLRFPVWSRMHTPNDYDVLMYVANWPAKRIKAWKSLLIARAIENQCYVVAVNRTGTDGSGLEYPGASCIIDPIGEILFMADENASVTTLSLDKSVIEKVRSSLPFLQDKDDFVILDPSA